MKKFLQSLFLLLFVAFQALAQERTVTGKVTDKSDGLPLPGVSIRVTGSSTGTTTGPTGMFSLNVPSGSSTLTLTYIGFTSQTVSIGVNSIVNVALQADQRQLSEVVVVGYGVQKRGEFTGSASSVSGDKIKDTPVQSFEQALGGKAAGVNIIQPNGVLNNPPVIRIRGFNSISLSSYPLVVVDGIPVNTGSVGNSAANNPLSDINPSDIESIDILKDAASTSIYGSRGAAGVILVTTKKGKIGASKVSYDGWFGIANASRLPDLLNAQEYMMIKNEAQNNLKISGGNVNNPSIPSALFFPTINADGSTVDTKWYDVVYRQAYSQNHSLNVSGATEKTSYYFSTNYSDQDGFIKTNQFNRKAAKFNIDQKVTNWLKVGANVNYANNFNSAPNTGSLAGQAFNTSGLGRLAIVTAPNVAPRNPDGTYNITSSNTMGQGNNLTQSGFINPLPLFDLNTFTSESNHIISSFNANVQLLKGLNFQTTYSIDRLNIENISFQSPVHGDGFTNKGNADNSYQRLDNQDFTNTLNYQTTIGNNHSFNALIGSDVQTLDNKGWGGSRSTVADNFFDTYQGSYTLTNQPGGNFVNERAFLSYFGRLNYDYGKKYFITGNFRRDGNSALAAGRKYGNFGGVSAGWALSEEGFYKKSSLAKTINNIKVKASWGRVGNGGLNNPYGSFFLFNAGLYADAPILSFSQVGNSNLQWETSDQTNFGIEMGFLGDKIQFEATYFNNDINGLILDARQATSKGIPGNSILTNVGTMYNKGLELGINATPVNKGKFSWTTNLNYTTIKNRVTSLSTGNLDIPGNNSGLESASITRVGHSLGSIYAVQTAGVNPENGRRIFINAKGQKVQFQHVVSSGQSRWTFLDGAIAPAITGADAQIIDNAIPTWFGGFDNSFKYGNLDLNFTLGFSGGNSIYNGSQAGLRDQRFWNNHTDMIGRWTTPGQQTNIPRVIFTDNVSNGSSFAISENVQSGDFLKMRNIALGYRLPASVFGKTGISSLRVYGSLVNAFIITDYKGTDPEVSSNGNSNLAPGVERNAVPQSRTFTFGINLGF